MDTGRMIFPPEPSDHLRIVAIIQARMGSTRLPGKVLMSVAGQPLIWHVVNRLKRSQLIEQIAVTTSVNPRDDAIVEWCQQNSVPVIRGPEDDVLARFARAAELLDADVIVRVAADAPFVDPGFVDHLVTALLEQDCDYVRLEDGAGAGALEGVDPFTRRALDKLMMDAREDKIAREHVTGYFKLHPQFVRTARAHAYPSLAREAVRLTVDTKDDLAFVEAVHERMAARAGEASLADLLVLLDREPQLRPSHAKAEPKPLPSVRGSALICCDGGGEQGYGQLKRMTGLARALRDDEGIAVRFLVDGQAEALDFVRASGFEATDFGSSNIKALAEQQSPNVVICDGADGVTRADLEELSRRSIVALIDDVSDRRRAADFAYYPPLPQIEALDWGIARCVVRIGWEWALLGGARIASSVPRMLPRPTLLVSMGESDAMGLTLGVARALKQLEPLFRARFVIAPGMADGAKLANAIVGLAPHFETVEGASDLATEYAACDLALTSFGVAAYELAAAGVPAVYLCQNEDHALSASAFERAGLGVSLGLAVRAAPADVARTVWALLSDRSRLREMRATALATIDGEAVSRIARDLATAISAKSPLPHRGRG
jgi:spore coat polysaccharide biosynthesis protein SpsF